MNYCKEVLLMGSEFLYYGNSVQIDIFEKLENNISLNIGKISFENSSTSFTLKYIHNSREALINQIKSVEAELHKINEAFVNDGIELELYWNPNQIEVLDDFLKAADNKYHELNKKIRNFFGNPTLRGVLLEYVDIPEKDLLNKKPFVTKKYNLLKNHKTINDKCDLLEFMPKVSIRSTSDNIKLNPLILEHYITALKSFINEKNTKYYKSFNKEENGSSTQLLRECLLKHKFEDKENQKKKVKVKI